ncbi:MAG: HlyD family secretion protein [Anaerolineae bacterium]
MKTLIRIVVISLLSLGLWGCSGFGAARPEATPPPAEDIERVVSATGVVLPARWATLGFQVNGRVERVMVEPGDQVEEGEPLIQLDSTDLEYAVSQAQAALATSQATLALAEVGARTEEIAALEAQLAAAKAELARLLAGAQPEEIALTQAQLQQTTTDLAHAQNRYDKWRWVGDETEEQLRYQRDAAAAANAAAHVKLDLVMAGPSAEEIAAAQARVDQVQAQLDLLRAGARPEEVAVAQAQVAQAKVALAQARSALEKAELRAPFTATIGEIRVREGEVVNARVPILTLGDLDHLRVETTDLNEIDIPLVKVGQEVRITFDALPERAIQGRVTQIAPMASREEGGTNYTVTIELEKQDPDLRWGMTAFVDILVER